MTRLSSAPLESVKDAPLGGVRHPVGVASFPPSIWGITAGVEGVVGGELLQPGVGADFLFLLARVSRGVTSCTWCYCCRVTVSYS